MNVLENLLVKALSMYHKGVLPADRDLIRSLVGAMGEAKIIELTNGEARNEAFDVMGNDRVVGRIEVKTAFKPTAGSFGSWSIKCKRNKCDYFAILEMSDFANDNYRISIIPHDAMFEHIDTPNRTGNNPDYFKWSESYNETDKINQSGTELFLKYEKKFKENYLCS